MNKSNFKKLGNTLKNKWEVKKYVQHHNGSYRWIRVF
jgi:hypothetical protein